MKKIDYIEDALTEIVDLFMWNNTDVSWQDQTILSSLNSSLKRNGSLTKKQGFLLLKILDRCQPIIKNDLDLESVLSNPQWKNNFRKLDLTKSIFIEQDEEEIWIVMKFPYSLLSEFEESVVTEQNKSSMQWDNEKRVKKLKFYDFNLIAVDEFVKKHGFNIDESFEKIKNEAENIWNQYDSIAPYSEILNQQVVLKNASSESIDYFKKNQKNSLHENMFLAKSMGYPVKLSSAPSCVLEKVVSEKENYFWVKDNTQFFNLYKSVNGISVIVIDRATGNIFKWLKNFIVDADINGISRNDIRVCFREKKDSNIPLNDWIKENGLGGEINSGKLFIFKHKPAKWIFSNNIDVKVIATNNIIGTSEPVTNFWLQSHPCVLCISDIKPTTIRNKKIVKV